MDRYIAITAVSYTHLDVYKRQGAHRDIGENCGILCAADQKVLRDR